MSSQPITKEGSAPALLERFAFSPNCADTHAVIKRASFSRVWMVLIVACSNGASNAPVDPAGTAGTAGSEGGASSLGGEGSPGLAGSDTTSAAIDGTQAAGAEAAPQGPGTSGNAAAEEGNPMLSGPPVAGEAIAGGGGAAGLDPPAAGVEREPIQHIFLLLGQSNMAGYAKAQDSDSLEDARVSVLGFDDCAATGRVADQWDIASPPLHECWNGAVGPGDWFAKTLLAALPAGDTIGLVPDALSGQAIEVFSKGRGVQYDRIVQRAEAALAAGGVIDGILFHQGESNCADPAWPARVQTLVSDLRTDLGLGDVPFLAGELPYSGSCAVHNALVAQLPALIPNTYVVSARDLAVDPADTRWNLHFGHDETVELGRRYAEAMIKALTL